MHVFILATLRDLGLLDYSTLVFKTLRVGFPTATVHVHVNRVDAIEIPQSIIPLDCEITHTRTIHHDWIQALLMSETEPFWICDTDIVFYESIEAFPVPDGAPLFGWRIPEWVDQFSGCVTRARLHTSLLRIDPSKIRDLILQYSGKIADTVFTPKVNLVNPLVVPLKGKSYFYDTCSLLYHAIGGTAFTDAQKSAYCHLNFGTIPDIVLPRLDQKEAQAMILKRESVLKDPKSGKSAWREQEAYYQSHQL